MKKKKMIMTICLVFVAVLFIYLIQNSGKDSTSSKDVLETMNEKEIIEDVEPNYLAVELSDLPMDLQHKIGIAINSLNSGDRIAYCYTYDLKGSYDLITRKIGPNSSFGWFNDFSQKEIDEAIEETSKEDPNLSKSTFEEYLKVLLSDLFEDYFDEVPLPKYSINSVSMHPSKKYVRVYLDVKREGEDNFLGKTDWVYYDGNWWQQDYFDGSRLK